MAGGIAPNVTIQTVTNQYLAPKWYDLTLRDNRLFAEIMKKPKKWNGSQTLVPIKYGKGLSTVAFNGYDLLPIGQQPVSVNMTFYPSFTATNVSLAGSDLSINATDMQTISLMSQTMASRAEDGADDFGNFLQGDGTTFGGKAPNGLANTIDNGTVAATYGGLTRATYSGLNSYVTTATNNAISLLQLRTSWNNISDGGVMPDFTGTDYTTWAYIEQLMTPFQRNNQDYRPNDRTVSQVSGYSDLRWEGMIIIRDKKFVTGNLYMLNLKFLEWQGLKWWKGEAIAPKGKDIEGNVYDEKKYQVSGAMTWTGMIEAYNQGTVNGFIIIGGQLVCMAPFRQALISGIQGAA
jgi:hypothetical protein